MAAVDHDQELLQKVHGLSDLELAALLSLVAREHCLVSTSPEAVGELTEELRLIAHRTFGLSSAVVSCHAHTTLDDFATALLVIPPTQTPSPAGNGSSNNKSRSISPYRPRHPAPQSHHHDPAGSYFAPHPGSSLRGGTSGHMNPLSSSSPPPMVPASSQPQIANVILAKHLDRAPRAVQIQALELLRTRRIFTRTSVQTAPKQFLFVALVGAASGGLARVTPHLNDFFYLAHWHDPEDGFDYLDEEWGFEEDEEDDGGNLDDGDDDRASTDSSTSVVKRGATGGSMLKSSFNTAVDGRPSISLTRPDPPPQQRHRHRRPVFSEGDLAILAQLGRQVRVDVDVARYQVNIVSFLRTHRAVGGGITPTATKHFEQLVRSLAPLHGLDFATPSLVALAAKKVYLHRVRMVAPERERSMQWGSELAAVEVVLDGLGPEDVIEDVLGMVAVPH